MNLVTTNQQPTMTSLELVDFINAEQGFSALTHANFLAKVPKVLGERSHSFECDLPDSYGRPRRGYRFPKREACLMAMSYSYELQAAVFDRMTQLEQTVSAPQIPDFSNPVLAARAWADAKEAEQVALIELQKAAPAVAFVEKYVDATGLKGFRETCKLLKVSEPEFRRFLSEEKIQYLLGGKWTAYQNHIDAGRFDIRAGVNRSTGYAFNEALFTPKGIEWAAGEFAKWQLKSLQTN